MYGLLSTGLGKGHWANAAVESVFVKLSWLTFLVLSAK